MAKSLSERIEQKLEMALQKLQSREFATTVEQGLRDIKSMAGMVRENSAPLGEMIDELKMMARHPRTLSSWLETKSPWLSRQVLGAASNLSEPFTLGMGLRVSRVGEEAIEVLMSGGWRNRGDGGLVHMGALATLGEFAVRLYWEHHLDLRSVTLESQRVEVRVLSRPIGEMKAVFHLPVGDREVLMHRLRADGDLVNQTETLIYDNNGRLVAEVDVEWRLSRQLALAPGLGSSFADEPIQTEDHPNDF